MRRLSVVIPNYNYERFVGEAIESALALDWPDVEVVVVDDGSTDASLEVIRRYEDRVRVLATENAKQRVAVNRGLALVTGDVVIVLDSDDVLPADLPQHLARAWGPQVSKAQFRMQRVDEHGAPLGAPFPRLARDVSPADITDWYSRTSAYPTPPGSGNAYAKWFIDLVAPIDQSTGDFADSALLAAAPLLGEVVIVPQVVVGYRQHASNDSDLLVQPSRFRREVDRARRRWEFAQVVASTRQLDTKALYRSRELLQLRVAALIMTPELEPGLRADSRVRMLYDAARAPLHPGAEGLPLRVAVAVWCLATLLVPSRVARQLVGLRFRRSRA